eukprot:s3026_g8.t1
MADVSLSLRELGKDLSWNLLVCQLSNQSCKGHDMLVTPTRAQMNDIFPPDLAESRAAMVAGVAKIVAVLFATLLSRTAAFLTVAVIAAVATLTQLAAGPSKEIREIREIGQELTPVPEAEGRICPIGFRDMWRTTTNRHKGFWEMWLLRFAGWLSVCTWSFYFSSVWADIEGTTPGTSAFDAAVHAIELHSGCCTGLLFSLSLEQVCHTSQAKPVYVEVSRLLCL